MRMTLIEITAIALTGLATFNTILYSALKYKNARKDRITKDALEAVRISYIEKSKEKKLSKLEEFLNEPTNEMDEELKRSLRIFIALKRSTKFTEQEVQNCVNNAKKIMRQKGKSYRRWGDKELEDILNEAWVSSKQSINDTINKGIEFHKNITNTKIVSKDNRGYIHDEEFLRI